MGGNQQWPYKDDSQEADWTKMAEYLQSASDHYCEKYVAMMQ